MMYKWLPLIGAVIVGLGADGMKTRCFEYPVDRLGAETVTYDDQNTSPVTERLEMFQVYYRRADKGMYPIRVGYKIAGSPVGAQTVYCHHPDNSRSTRCGVECDGGGFAHDEHYTIRPSPMSLERNEVDDGADGTDLILYPLESNITVVGREIACPQNLPKYYRDDPRGMHVCYDEMYDGAYIDCYRSVLPCGKRHDQHFGTYPTLVESDTALRRCQSSFPKSDYADDPKGLYVCYDHKDSKGTYDSCFQAVKPCKVLKKEHFGHYTNAKQSQQALQRCAESTPKR